MYSNEGFRWPTLNSLTPDTVTPPAYAYSELDSNDIGTLCELIRAWYPDISVGTGKLYTNKRYYEQEVSLADDDGKFTKVYVGKFEGQLVSAIFLQFNPDAQTMYSRFAVCAPEHRGSGVTLFGGYVMDALAEKIGVSMAYTYVTMKNRAMQQLVERSGFKPMGIVPFSDIELDAEKRERFIIEALYIKTYLPAHFLQDIEMKNLTPSMQKTWMSLSTLLHEH